jgi:hypothetical protein
MSFFFFLILFLDMTTILLYVAHPPPLLIAFPPCYQDRGAATLGWCGHTPAEGSDRLPGRKGMWRRRDGGVMVGL